MAKEREFLFTGALHLECVTFVIKAASESEAADRASAGQYDSFDTGGAAAVKWSIDPSSCEASD